MTSDYTSFLRPRTELARQVDRLVIRDQVLRGWLRERMRSRENRHEDFTAYERVLSFLDDDGPSTFENGNKTYVDQSAIVLIEHDREVNESGNFTHEWTDRGRIIWYDGGPIEWHLSDLMMCDGMVDGLPIKRGLYMFRGSVSFSVSHTEDGTEYDSHMEGDFELLPADPVRFCEDASEDQQPGALELIWNERLEQIDVHGFTEAHDDAHTSGELSAAALGFVEVAAWQSIHPDTSPTGPAMLMPQSWPFEPSWWRPKATAKENLIRAGALILAEIERLQRAEAKAAENPYHA